MTLAWDTTRATGCSIAGIGEVASSGSRVVNPISTTTYTLNCNTVGGGSGCSRSVTIIVDPFCPIPSPSDCPFTTPPPPCPPIRPISHPPFVYPSASVPDPTNPLSVSISVVNNRNCLPLHPYGDNPIPHRCPRPRIISTNINWEGNVINTCDGIIGGGSPNNLALTCRNTTANWGGFNITGQGRLFRTEGPLCPLITQTYGMMCRRHEYVCTDASRSWTGRTASIPTALCNANCAQLRNAFPNTLASCTCSTFCSQRGPRCIRWSECRRMTTCSRTVTDPDGRTREVTYPCEEFYDCPPCAEFECIQYRTNQRVVSHLIRPTTITPRPQQIRVIQAPCITEDSLVTDPVRPRILLNQFINLVWRIDRPDSGVPTRMRCTPSVAQGGDAEHWADRPPLELLDRLDIAGRMNNLSPNQTTIYQLFCRNRDIEDPGRCFSDSPMMTREVEVFTPDLREVPAFYDGFIRIVGRITDNLFR